MKSNKTEKILLDNGLVQAVFQLGTERVSEQFFAINEKKPQLIAETVSGSDFSAVLLAAEGDKGDRSNIVPDYRNNPPKQGPEFFMPLLSLGNPLPIRSLRFYDYSLKKEGARSEITLNAKSPEGYEVTRRISLKQGEACFQVSNSLRLTRQSVLEFFVDQYYFSPDSNPDFTWVPSIKCPRARHRDFTWTPSMKSDPSCVSADWTFKSPAVIIQKGASALSLVPDVKSLAEEKTLEKCNVGLDLDVTTKPRPLVEYGFIPSIPHYHSGFIHPRGLCVKVSPGTLNFTYYILLFADAPERQSYGKVASFLWSKFGHDNLTEGHAAQVKPFNIWQKESWHDFADKVWFEFNYDGEKCGAFRIEGLKDVVPPPDFKVYRFKDDAWFCAWWNNLRTAYGLELYARRMRDRQSSEHAHGILNLALKAPRKNGLFPIVYNRDSGEHHWDRDHMFGGYRDCYHNFDMSWTSYWLLKWLKDLVPEDKRILPLCVSYGDFLVKSQYENGFIPSYYEEDLTVKPDIRLNKESAEPAACALFLAELYSVTGEKKYLDASIKAMRYVEQYIMPENRWFDFETFLSCSRKPYDAFDEITGQHPQNNMCIIQVAQAFLALYDNTGEERFLELGMAVLDYLSLTQQVWSHPLLTPNLIGGFTTQNSDAEWSDARQAYCAVLYLDYFDRTGKLEYLERGIAALRSSFAVSPYENWAHDGYLDRPGVLSGFHWGLGSGMASVEMVWERYGDVLVNPSDRWAYGINGCTVKDFHVKGKQMQLRVESDLLWETPLLIVFRDISPGRYELFINGEPLGEFDADDLKKGIRWFFKK